MTRADVAELMAILAAAYPEVDIDPDTTGVVWERLLADLEFEETQRAVLELVATHKWFPRISEVRNQVARNRLGLPRFERVYAACSNDEERRALHPIAKEALQICGGVYEMRNTKNAGLWRRDFREVYMSLVSEAMEEQNLEGVALLDGGVVRRLN